MVKSLLGVFKFSEKLTLRANQNPLPFISYNIYKPSSDIKNSLNYMGEPTNFCWRVSIHFSIYVSHTC